MKDISAHLLKVIICIVLTVLMACDSSFDDAINDVNDSLETSNKILIDSNLKIYGYIISSSDSNNNEILTADSLFNANDEANQLIDKFKEEINNLKLVGKGNEHAQALFASPFTFAPLIGVISNVDTRASRVMSNSPRKVTLDSILLTARSLSTDPLWRKINVEDANVNSVLMVLSGLQMSCSKATNLALSEINKSLIQYSQSEPSP